MELHCMAARYLLGHRVQIRMAGQKHLRKRCRWPKAFGYWTLSDLIEERPLLQPALFHGGFGLMTMNGLPKTGWTALTLLQHLGEQKIGSGDGWFAAHSGSSIQLLFYHYCHYDNLHRHRNPDAEFSAECISGVPAPSAQGNHRGDRRSR